MNRDESGNLDLLAANSLSRDRYKERDMSWYKIILTHEDIAALKHMELQDQFARFFTAHNGPRDAGMYQSNELGIHEYFFSPGAGKIAFPLIASYSGVECIAPTRSEVKPLVENAGSEGVAFRPESST
jgi:hypothetical protein